MAELLFPSGQGVGCDRGPDCCRAWESLPTDNPEAAEREFPWRVTPTPVGTFVYVSFSCDRVRRNEGPSLADSVGHVKKLWPASRRVVPEAREEVNLLTGSYVPWKPVLAVTRDLDALFGGETPDISLPGALVVADRMVAQLQALAEEKIPEGKSAVPMQKLIDRTRGTPLAPPGKLSMDARSILTGLLLRAVPRERRIKGSTRRMGRWFSAAFGGKAITLADGATVSLRRAFAGPTALPDDGENLLRRFLRVRFHSQAWHGPPTGLTVVAGARYVLLQAAVVVLIARAYAATASRAITLEDIDRGVQAVSDGLLETPVTPGLAMELEAMLTRKPAAVREVLLACTGGMPGGIGA